MRDMIGETRFDLIDRLIAEPQYLSAVERSAQKHEQAKVPLQAKYYRDLIPLTKPGKDQQYSFEVDLDIKANRFRGNRNCEFRNYQ
jgi:hypothetical protein